MIEENNRACFAHMQRESDCRFMPEPSRHRCLPGYAPPPAAPETVRTGEAVVPVKVLVPILVLLMAGAAGDSRAKAASPPRNDHLTQASRPGSRTVAPPSSVRVSGSADAAPDADPAFTLADRINRDQQRIPPGGQVRTTCKPFRYVLIVGVVVLSLAICGAVLWHVLQVRISRRRVRRHVAELTDLRQAQDALRESEEMFRVLAETSPAGIFLYQGEYIVYVNPAMAGIMGYTERECLGMRYWEWVREDYRKEIRERGQARQRGESVPSRYEARHLGKNGEEKWLLISAGLIEYKGQPAGIVTVFDITERKRMEEELRRARGELERRVRERTAELAAAMESLRFTQFAIDRSMDQAFWVTGDGRFYYVNDAACRALGYSREELAAMSLPDIDPTLEPAAFPGVWKDLRNRGAVTFETRHRARDGREYPVEVRTNHVNFDGKEYNCAFVTDISARKLFEEELRQKTRLLEELNGTLEKRVREEVAKNREKDTMLIQQNRQAALGEMLDHIAHQWKQPLTAISLTVQDLGETASSGELTLQHVDTMVSKTMALLEHMTQTIQVFRDFYRPDKEKKEFSIIESIDQALAFIGPALRFHSVEIGIEADPALTAYGFPKEYSQVLLNVLANARDVFRERRTEAPRIDIRAFADGDKAVVTISDNGGGIPPAVKDRIFDFHFTTGKSRGGSGIGLYMSRNIIENNMEGRLGAENADDGARFRIEIPSRQPPGM